MTLDRALHILSRVHLREDDLAGFTVQMGAMPDWGNCVSNEEYIEAWEAVWNHTHMRTETAESEVVKLRAALDTLTDQAGAYMDVTKEYFSDSAYDANGLLAETDAALFVTLYDLRRARAAYGKGGS